MGLNILHCDHFSRVFNLFLTLIQQKSELRINLDHLQLPPFLENYQGVMFSNAIISTTTLKYIHFERPVIKKFSSIALLKLIKMV